MKPPESTIDHESSEIDWDSAVDITCSALAEVYDKEDAEEHITEVRRLAEEDQPDAAVDYARGVVFRDGKLEEFVDVVVAMNTDEEPNA